MRKSKNFFILGLIILSGIYLFLRLYKFEEKTTYHLDQGLHLLESWEMVQNRDIRLIGPMVSSKTFLDRGFFIGPQYYYVLSFLGILTNWNPISIDLFLLFLEFGFILYFIYWIVKKFGKIEALTVFSLFTFSKFFIIHSRFFWNPHFLLPLGILAIIALYNYINRKEIKYLALFSFFWGIAFGFHYAAVLWGIPLLIILIKNKIFLNKNTFIVLPLFIILGDLPWFVFELRNNFYNVKTIWWAMSQSTDGGKIEPHYLVFPLIIFVMYWLVLVISKIRINKMLFEILIIIISSLLQIYLIKQSMPYGHPKGWNYIIEKETIKKILNNGCPNNFNVASTVSGDTRSYDLRFLLIRNKCKPMDVDKYPEAKTLFLVAPTKRRPENESVWEVSSMGKFKIKREETLNETIKFYELEKK